MACKTTVLTYWNRPQYFCDLARDAFCAYRHFAAHIVWAQCIKCDEAIPRRHLTSPSCLRPNYVLPCCGYYVHFQCWLELSQKDYICNICDQQYPTGRIRWVRQHPDHHFYHFTFGPRALEYQQYRIP